MIADRLEIIRRFQEKYPLCHVGGSFGLYLHGIDLQRDLSRSDIDITAPELLKDFPGDNVFYGSNPEDFDQVFDYYPKGIDSYYVKVEVTVKPEKKFVVIEHEGFKYNVSKVEDILAWKHFYSMKGAGKHTDDLEVIRTGVRPNVQEQKVIVHADEIDDLPF